MNAKGRASYKGGTLKAPVKSGDNPRRASFLARMGGMRGPERDSKGRPTRLLLSLRAWGASSKADAKRKAAAISRRNKAKKKRKDNIMPMGKGTYGSKRGRPPAKKNGLTAKQKTLPKQLQSKIMASKRRRSNGS